MAHQARCPSCGAPIEYAGEEDTIHCNFCDTELRVVEEEGQPRFQILAQPGPQKEVLSRAVGAAEPAPEPVIKGEPVFPGEEGFLPTEEPQRSEMPVFSPTLSGSTSEQASSTVIDAGTGAQVYPPAPRSNATRWIWISLAVVLGLCLVCACIAATVLVINYQAISF